jgi:hypothetical protein
VLVLAPKARYQPQPGAPPQGKVEQKIVSAESAIHFKILVRYRRSIETRYQRLVCVAIFDLGTMPQATIEERLWR